jgi:hypothetical protein
MNCQFCNKECKNDNSLRNHQRLCKLNTNRQMSPFENPDVQQNRKKSNPYIKAKEKNFVYVMSAETRDKIGNTQKSSWTPERRAEWSAVMKVQAQKNIENHPDSYSYKNFCGRAKKSLYKEEWMHSSWELYFAMWCDANDIKWTKKVKSFQYEWDGSTRKYFPDFYLPEHDLYVEVKGYETDRDIVKWNSVPNLVVLKDKHIKQIKENKFSLGQVS